MPRAALADSLYPWQHDSVDRPGLSDSRTVDRIILMADFREEDAAGGRPMSEAVRLRQLVSKASGGQEKPQNP